MHLTVTSISSDHIFPLDIPDDLELENLKAFCEAESGMPAAEILVLLNGKPLTDDKKTMKDFGVKDGDMLAIDRVKKKAKETPKSEVAAGGMQLPDFSKISMPGMSSSAVAGPSTPRKEEDPQWIKSMLLANPEQMANLKQNNPKLAEALEKDDMVEFEKILKEQMEAKKDRERMRQRMLTADPFDMEAQRLIAQEIESKNIDQNMELAMEYNPESFGQVVMLYIDCVVNGHHIKAFVDSGAQATIMSAAAAERCGIMRLVDKRWAGIAKGVGTQKIIGRVHMVQIQIAKDFLTSSFSILEEQPMDMLLGLDMLKRHQCVIDLNKNSLIIGSTGSETKFLPESELPECARLSSKAQDVDSAMEQSAKEAEDKQLKEALSKSEADSKKAGEGSSSSAAGATPMDTSVGAEDKFKEEDVETLVKYGFSREASLKELREQNGDLTKATAALFAKSLKF